MIRPLKLTIFTLSIYTLFSLSSCTKIITKPVLPYFQGSTVTSYPVTLKVHENYVSTIQTEDILGITVSSLNKESNDILNFSNVNSLPLSSLPGGGGGGQQPIGYPVDRQGNVSMAFIGKVNVLGLSLEEAQSKIATELVKYLKEPAVNIRFMNHKFTVLGEVNGVGSFTLLDDRTTIIDALASAGDMKDYAKRDSVTVIRIVGGKRTIGKLNLLTNEVFSSPYFFIQNGDVIYVEPFKEKNIRYTDDTKKQNLQTIITVSTIFTSLVTLIIALTR
jgi:polysaccharide export outer membrane protein